MDPRESLSDVRRSSTIDRFLRRGMQNSTVVNWMQCRRSQVMAVENWVRSSTTVEVIHEVSGEVRKTFDRSETGTVARAIVGFVRSSFCYRWLTAEPEPEVIVVDLRETIVLGPLLPKIDDLVETFLSSRSGSRLFEVSEDTIEFVEDAPVRALSIVLVSAIAANAVVRLATGSMTTAGLHIRLGLALVAILGFRIDTSLDELRQTWVARLLVALLEPPEPYDEDVQVSGEPDDTNRPPPSHDGNSSKNS